ncbi:MAG: hypothetical protein GQ556_00070 [Desulfobacterales bacterium]|nr:hypothetical protein [Desulfobacterales bacterium]
MVETSRINEKSSAKHLIDFSRCHHKEMHTIHKLAAKSSKNIVFFSSAC